MKVNGLKKSDQAKENLQNLVVFLIITFLLLSIYIKLSPDFLVGRDSGEFSVAAKHLSSTHPPGSPAFNLISGLFHKSMTISPLKAVSLNAITGSILTIFCLYLILYEITDKFSVSLVSAFFILTVQGFIKSSVYPETDSLALGFYALIFLCTLKRELRTTGFFLVPIGYAVHPITVFASLPLFIVELIDLRRHELRKAIKRIFYLSAAILLGSSIFLYLPIRGAKNTKWGLDKKENVFEHISMTNFKSDSVPLSSVRESVEPVLIFQHMFLQKGVWGIWLSAVSIIGLIWLLLDRTSIFFMVIIGGLPLIVYLGLTGINYRLFDQYLLPAYMLTIVCFGVGLNWFVNELTDANLNLSIVGLLFLLILYTAGQILETDSFNRFDTPIREMWGKAVLDSCQENALLLISRDNRIFILDYIQQISGYREDVKVVALGLMQYDWYINKLGLNIEDNANPSESAVKLALRELDNRPVHTLFSDDPEFASKFTPQIYGLTFRLWPRDFRPSRAPNTEIFKNLNLDFPEVQKSDPEAINLVASTLTSLDILERLRLRRDDKEGAEFYRKIIDNIEESTGYK